jgi:hemerythrin-like domain-containing protein
MEATEILMAEHGVIERVLGALEMGAARLEAGEDVRPEFFLQATDFIRGFADGCHHRKEEGVLFVALGEAGLPEQTGPVAVMLAEHDQARAYTRALRSAAEKMAAGDAGARAEAIQYARADASLLRGHIYKENNVLFPMADRLIPQDVQPGLTDAFEHVEHEETGAGVHEKYLALAEALVSEANEMRVTGAR